MAPDTPEEKRDLFEATGELKGGYDMGMAQAYALDHAKKTQGEYVGEGRQRVPLIWDIESSRYDEDAECFKVVLTCHPEGVDPEQKGMWEYHVRSTGGLMPGTPLLRQSLRYTLAKPKKGGRPWAWALLVLVVLALLGGGVYAVAAPGLANRYIRSLLSSPTATPPPLFRPTSTPIPTKPVPTATAVVRATVAPALTPVPTAAVIVLPTATLPPKPIATPVPLATLARPTPTRPPPTATLVPTPMPTATPTTILRPTPTPTARPPGSTTLNFGGLGTGDLGGNALAPWGIWLTTGSLYVSPVEPKGQVVPSGITQVAQLLGPGFPQTVPHCTIVAFTNPVSPTTAVGTVTSFTITRIGTTGGGSTPAWRMRAYDVQGKQVGADVGEGPIPNTTGYFNMPATPASFTVAGPAITKVEFCAHNTLSTYGSLPIFQIAYTK